MTGPDRFAAAARWWELVLDGLEVDDPVGVPGSGPVAFASFGFDPGGQPPAHDPVAAADPGEDPVGRQPAEQRTRTGVGAAGVVDGDRAHAGGRDHFGGGHNGSAYDHGRSRAAGGGGRPPRLPAMEGSTP